MWTLKRFLVATIAISFGYLISSTNSQKNSEVNQSKGNKGIFRGSVEKFQDFSNDFYREAFASRLNQGANVIFPFGVAHLLSVLNEQTIWDVSSNGVDYALWTSKENLTQEYSSLIGVLNKFNSFRGMLKSYDEIIPASEGFQSLHVQVENKTITGNSGEEKEEFTVRDSWDHSQRHHAGHEFRKALFANTMYLPNYWFREMSTVGQGVFNGGEVNTPYLESKCYTRTQETSDFIAVALPLATFGQTLVLVLPKVGLANVVNKKNLQHFIQSSPKSKEWSFHPTRIYVPALNFITAGNFLKPLTKLGVQYLMCNPETETQLQPISQATYVYLGADGFDILTVTSTELANVTEYKALNNVFKREVSKHRRIKRSEMMSDDELLKKMGDMNPLYGLDGAFDQELILWAAQEANNPPPNSAYKTIAFNKPFYWYLYDDNFGPSFAGMVESIAQIPKSYYEEPFARKGFPDWIKDMDATYKVPKCPQFTLKK